MFVLLDTRVVNGNTYLEVSLRNESGGMERLVDAALAWSGSHYIQHAFFQAAKENSCRAEITERASKAMLYITM